MLFSGSRRTMRTFSACKRRWRVVCSLPVTAAQKSAVTAYGWVHEIS